MRKYYTIALMLCSFMAAFLYAKENITLNEILIKVQEDNLELKSIQKKIEAAESGVIQAGLFPNPELEIEAENFGKDEIGFGFGQSFELGGKRKSRIEIAEIEVEKLELEFGMKMLELEIETMRRVLPLLTLNKKLALLDSIITIEESTLETIQKRVEAGTTMPIDALRAEIELEEINFHKRVIEQEMIRLHENLPSLWSSAEADLITVSGKLLSEMKIPDIEVYHQALLEHPEIQMMKIERKLSRAELKEVIIDAVPDLSIGVGFKRSMEAEENAVGITASIDLPIFNRNQGEIKSREHSLDALEFDTENTIINKQAELQKLYNHLRTVKEELETIETKILPKAETVYQTLLDYYKRGSVSLLDVIEAQTELLDYKTRVIENHSNQAEILIDLYELTGHHIKIISNK